MSTSHSVTIELGYTNTTSTRQMTISDLSDEVLPQIESKIQAINASLAGGTDGGLGAFFRSDDFDASQNKGTFNKINFARVESVEEVYIFGGKS